MNTKLMLILIIGLTLFFGCTNKAVQNPGPSNFGSPNSTSIEKDVVQESKEVENQRNESDDTIVKDIPKVETIDPIKSEEDLNQDKAEKELADLFQLDTDPPIGDSGLASDSPGSK